MHERELGEDLPARRTWLLAALYTPSSSLRTNSIILLLLLWLPRLAAKIAMLEEQQCQAKSALNSARTPCYVRDVLTFVP